MKTLSVRSDRPLDPITVEVLNAVDSAARDLAIGYFVTGAMARDIVLLDAAQRVYYASSYPVDLVPFGGVVENDGNLVWPPERAIVMNVLGYYEALAASLKVEVKPGTVVPVASLASLGMLKVFAWVDRGTRDRKDAQDLALLLRRYADTIDPEHLYGSEAAVLEAVDYDHERAGARLLGKHIRQMAARRTAEQLLGHLQSGPARNRLAIAMAQAWRSSEDPVERAGQFLGASLLGCPRPEFDFFHTGNRRRVEVGEVARLEVLALALDQLGLLVVLAAQRAQIRVVERAAVELREVRAVVERDEVGGGEEEAGGVAVHFVGSLVPVVGSVGFEDRTAVARWPSLAFMARRLNG